MLASAQNNTSSRSILPIWLAGRIAPTKRRKAKHAHGSILTPQDPLGAHTNFQAEVTHREPNRTVDSQSSTRLLTNASGVVTDNYAYRAFGTEWQSGNGSRNSYRYVGQYGYYRDSAAMQYVRARYLDVQAGRWISRDPIGYFEALHGLYLYVNNKCMRLIDPTGLVGMNNKNYSSSGQVSCRFCQSVCKTGQSPALAEYCRYCWENCKMICSEWNDRKDPPLCQPGYTPVFITEYDPGAKRGGDCAVYCSTSYCCKHRNKKHKTYPPGSNRPLCNPHIGIHIHIPGFGNCLVNNGGCGQFPGSIPQPNNWIDFPINGNKSCWVCIKLPPGCDPNKKYPSPHCT